MRVAWVIKLSPPPEVGTTTDLPHQERGSWSSRDATALSHDGPTTWAFAAERFPTEGRTYNFLLMSGSLSTRSSLPVVGASPVPYHPALTKRDTMPKDDPHVLPEALPSASRRGRVAVLLFVVVLALLVAVGAVVSRSEEATSSAPSSSHPAGSASTAATIAVVKQTEITSRLREILKVRDRALLARDAQLLSDIYTVDCKCLEDGKALIRQLRKENVVWKGVSTNMTIESTEKVNDRLWIVVATVRTPPVRIEPEAGRLVRIVPSERNRVRFALAKPTNEEEWLLLSRS